MQRPASQRLIVHVGNASADALDGVTMTIRGQTKALFSLGKAVEIWSFSQTESEKKSVITQDGIVNWLLPLSRLTYDPLIAFPPVTRSWIISRIREVRLFHLHSVFTPVNNLIAALGVPYVVTPNGGWEPRVLKGRRRLLKKIWIYWKEKKLWTSARFIQGVSPSECRNLAGVPGIAPIEYIPNGVEPAPDGEDSTSRNLWLYMGRLAIQQKGLDKLIEAYAVCKNQMGSLPRLILAGPDFRGDEERLKHLVASHGLATDISFPGPVLGQDKEELFSQAALFLHTSRWEGMPLAVLEALAHGIPSLVTRGTNMAELISKAGAGFDAGESIDDIVKAMAKAVDSDLRAMGRKATGLVARHFSWKMVAKKLATSYDNYIEK